MQTQTEVCTRQVPALVIVRCKEISKMGNWGCRGVFMGGGWNWLSPLWGKGYTTQRPVYGFFRWLGVSYMGYLYHYS